MAQRKRPASGGCQVGDKPYRDRSRFALAVGGFPEKVSRESDGLPQGDSIEAFGHAFTVLSVVQKRL